MSHHDPNPLTIAVRVYPEPPKSKQATRPRKPWSLPGAMLVFDTETRTDAAQRLTFGSYRFFVGGKCLEERLFYADDLPEKDREVLKHYVAKHRAETGEAGVRELLLLTLGEFLEKTFRAAYKGRCLLVGFNLPFDLSRLPPQG